MKQPNNELGSSVVVPWTRVRQFVMVILLLAGCGDTPTPVAIGNAPVEGQNTSTAMTAADQLDSDPIYRVRVDHQRGRYWVLGDAHIQVYSVSRKRLIAKIMIPGWNVAGSVGMPDLVLEPSGAALVSSNVASMLWHIDPDRFTVTRKEILLRGRENWSVGFSGLAFTPEGTLIGVTSFGGTLWKIEVQAGNATQIELSKPLLDARELWVVHQPASSSTLVDTVLCVSTGMTFYEVNLDAKKNAAVVHRASLGCKRSS